MLHSLIKQLQSFSSRVLIYCVPAADSFLISQSCYCGISARNIRSKSQGKRRQAHFLILSLGNKALKLFKILFAFNLSPYHEGIILLRNCSYHVPTETAKFSRRVIRNRIPPILIRFPDELNTA